MVKKKMSMAELKKELKQMSQDQMIDLVTRLYKSSKEACDLINGEFAGDAYLEQMLEESKAKVRKEFFPTRGMGRLSLSAAKSAISAFKKVCGNPKYVLDLQLYYVECGVEFTNTYGDITEAFYDSMDSMYSTVVRTLNKLDDIHLFELFKDRLIAVIDETGGCGWGFNEGLCFSYGSLKWVEEDDEYLL
ncbi:MAG: DUF6155 family protein [Eubacteriales bacterium]|nr:DUF6155 family protein [Eubacteriales bacterium]